MDIYSTTALNGVVGNLILPQSFLLNRFFRNELRCDTEEIKFDIDKGKRRIAPLVSPLRAGKIVASRGYQTNTFKPAYVKDKRVFDPGRPLKRAIGEAIGGVLKPMERMQLHLIRELADQVDMLTRRQEVMAAEGLRTGKVTVAGDDYETVVVDFLRDASLSVALTAGARWNQEGSDPLMDIENWALLVLQKSGAVALDVVMDIDGWRAFRDNAKVKDRLNRLANSGSTPLELGAAIQPGAQFMGSLDGRNFWVYVDWYVNDAGQEVPMLPSGTVLLGGPQIDGTRHFGAIRDEDAGYQALPYFSKSWVEKDPAVRLLLMQSAPLPVPTRIDATFCATVL